MPPVAWAVVVLGGAPPHPRSSALIPPGATVIAADGGVDHAGALGVRVDAVIGDLDSASPAALADAARAGIPIDRHPAEKDATDAELALRAALATGARRVRLLGGLEGRLDHLMAVALLLAHPDTAGVELDAWIGAARLVVARPGRAALVCGRAGDLVTLLPVGGPAEGVTTDGLRYPLHAEHLDLGTSRGVSNELLGTHASVTVTQGNLLVVQPEALR